MPFGRRRSRSRPNTQSPRMRVSKLDARTTAAPEPTIMVKTLISLSPPTFNGKSDVQESLCQVKLSGFLMLCTIERRNMSILLSANSSRQRSPVRLEELPPLPLWPDLPHNMIADLKHAFYAIGDHHLIPLWMLKDKLFWFFHPTQ